MSNTSGQGLHTAVIVGGAGEVGEGIVRVLLDAGVQVFVPGRGREKLEELRRRLGSPDSSRLITLEADVSTPEGAALAGREVERVFPSVDLVVASVGGWWQGSKLVEVPLETWQRIVHDGLTGHFMVARTFLPKVRPGGSYVLINGAGGTFPVPGSGPISIVASAQLMLKDVLAAESGPRGVRVNTALIMSPVRSRSRTQGAPDWVSSEDVGKFVLHLAGKGDVHGKTIRLESHSQVAGLISSG